jgi:hypothetical protein
MSISTNSQPDNAPEGGLEIYNAEMCGILKKPDINPLTQDSSQQPAVANTVTDIQVE